MHIIFNREVGSLDNPADLPGLAHFLEHMLFTGSEKYPDGDTFPSFLSLNAGLMNAYTDDEDTNYFFSCQNGAFRKGFDIWSRFFIDPLLS